jgi:hypothetical protein
MGAMRAWMVPLLFLLGCPQATDRRPYALLGDDDSADDDDTGDDDTGDDDDSTIEPCDVSWVPIAQEDVSFSASIEPVLVLNCGPCHTLQGVGEQHFSIGGSWEELVGVANSLGYGDFMPRVTPGEPENSYLLHKLVNCPPGDPTWGYLQGQMPPLVGGGTPLTPEQVGQIWAWIAQGAADN